MLIQDSLGSRLWVSTHSGGDGDYTLEGVSRECFATTDWYRTGCDSDRVMPRVESLTRLLSQAVLYQSSASRAYKFFDGRYLGLTPQALCFRALRALHEN